MPTSIGREAKPRRRWMVKASGPRAAQDEAINPCCVKDCKRRRPLAGPKSKLKIFSSKPGMLVRPAADNEAKSKAGGADADGKLDGAEVTEDGVVEGADAGEL